MSTELDEYLAITRVNIDQENISQQSNWRHQIYYQYSSQRVIPKYTAKDMPRLFELSQEDDNCNTHGRIRFVLLANNPISIEHLILGQDGDPVNGRIGSHADLAADHPVFAAGTFFLKNGKIIGIDYKSGDFRPDMSCLEPVKFLLGQQANRHLVEKNLITYDLAGKELFTEEVANFAKIKLPDLNLKPEVVQRLAITPSKPRDTKETRRPLRPLASRGIQFAPSPSDDLSLEDMFMAPSTPTKFDIPRIQRSSARLGDLMTAEGTSENYATPPTTPRKDSDRDAKRSLSSRFGAEPNAFSPTKNRRSVDSSPYRRSPTKTGLTFFGSSTPKQTLALPATPSPGVR